MAPGDYLFKKSRPPDAKGFGESGQAAVGVDHPAKRRLQGFPIERRSRGSI